MIKIRLLTILFMAALLSFSCSHKDLKTNEIQNPVNPAFVKSVKTVKAGLSHQQEEITLTGKVEADPDQSIRYIPLINGVIDRAYFSLGDKVQKGQTLLDIRSTELTSLESELISLESELKIASRELKTAQALFRDDLLSERELLEAEGRQKQAQAALNKVKNDMSVFGRSKGNGVFSVKAPMSGYVISKNASSGSTISTDSEPLFSIANLSTVWITANIYASNLLFVKEGMNCEITTLSYPGEVFYGKINTLSQVFDPEDKTLKARIVLPNKEMKFKPEMSVMIKLKNEQPHQLITVPSEALIFDKDRYFVVVQDSSQKFDVKEVKVSGHHADHAYIASGLTEGENIVVKNQLLIYSGLKED